MPIALILVWIGSVWFSMLVGLVVAVGALELSKMAHRWGDRPITVVAVTAAACLVVASHLLSRLPWVWKIAVLVTVGSASSVVWLLRRPRTNKSPSVWVATVGVALYAGGFLFHAPLLRALEGGHLWILLLLLVTFTSDTAAFTIGRIFGKRPLAPSLSPSKTWEGSLAGLGAALISSIVVAMLLDVEVSVLESAILGTLIGGVGQLGDLAESRLKRIAGVKDSGWVLPGHGGVFDRLDSIVFSLVVVYYFAL